MKVEKVILTEDGSHTLKLADHQEHYHSVYGALAESRHVFIESGLKYTVNRGIDEIRILEVGFGTGLNTLLSICENLPVNAIINYYTVEAYPVEEQIWRQLNYSSLIEHKMAVEWFTMIHQAPWNEAVPIRQGFMLEKQNRLIQELENKEESFNLVYFDAFGPDIQPEMWTEGIFTKIGDMTMEGGVLVTYSAKGSVRRAMQKAGFVVERIPGPKGKREMLRGIKTIDHS